MAQPAAPGINLISLAYPEAAARQMAIQRQQALAQQLIQQGMQQDDPAKLANPGGLVVPVSPLQGLAKALQQGVGGYMQGKSDRDTLDMYKALGTSPSPDATGQAPAPTADNRALGQQLSGGPQAPSNPFNLPAGVSIQDVARTSMLPDAWQNVIADKYKQTDTMKNDAYRGITAPQSRALGLAEAAKNIGVPGAMPAFGPDGSMSVAPVPGAQGAIQGNKRAETLGGMTKAVIDGKEMEIPTDQYVQMLNGQPGMNPPAAPTGGPVTLTSPTGAPINDAPLGVRNNNPGNLRTDVFNGTTGTDKHGYAQFAKPEDGIRATALNLKNQQDLHGLNTVDGIISKYAPKGDNNNTAAYIEAVSNKLGVASDQPLDLHDPHTLFSLTNAVIQHENGQNPYHPVEVAKGVMTALGEAPIPQAAPKPPVIGQSAADKSANESAGKAAGELPQQINEEANSALGTKRLLLQMGEDAKNFTPGKAAAWQKEIAKYKLAAGIADDDDTRRAAAMENVDKLSAQLATQAMKQFTNRGTQMEFKTFLANNPNTAMTPQGFQMMLDFMGKTAEIPLQKQQEFATWKQGKSPSQYGDFEAHWNKKLSDNLGGTLTQVPGGQKPEASRALGGKNYVKINGQWFEQ